MTRITGSLTYGWLAQNDFTFNTAGINQGLAGLAASTFTVDIAGQTRPIAPLALKESYRAYNYMDDNTANQVLQTAFAAQPIALLGAEHYSYFRQAVNLGADYSVNQMLAFNLGYTWRGDSRTEGMGNTSSHSPQAGVRLLPTDWLSLMANYSFTTRTGSNFLWRRTRRRIHGHPDLQIIRGKPQPEQRQSHCRSVSRGYCHLLPQFFDL